MVATTAQRWTLSPSETGELREYAVGSALAYGADCDLAEDIAHITLLRLNEAAERNPAVLRALNSSSARAYVSDATRRALLGHREAEERRLSLESQDRVGHHELIDTSELDDLLAVMMLEELTAQLSEIEQLFVHLRYFEGQRITDIAHRLGVSETSARSVGRSANRKLRSRLQAGS